MSGAAGSWNPWVRDTPEVRHFGRGRFPDLSEVCDQRVGIGRLPAHASGQASIVDDGKVVIDGFVRRVAGNPGIPKCPSGGA